MTDVWADVFLAFSNASVILLVLITGFFLLNCPIFFQVLIMCLLDLIVNVALKGTFKVPLSPVLHKVGYAFPSGHMQLSAVLYIGLSCAIKLWSLRFFLMCLLVGIACALVHYDYHNAFDVMAGFVCGGVLVALFRYGLYTCANIMPWLLMSIASLFMIYNGWSYQKIPVHASIAYGLLLGLIIVERFFVKNEHRQDYWRITSLSSH